MKGVLKTLSHYRLSDCSLTRKVLDCNSDFVLMEHTSPCIRGQFYVVKWDWYLQKTIVPLARVIKNKEKGEYWFIAWQPEYFSLDYIESCSIRKEIEYEVE